MRSLLFPALAATVSLANADVVPPVDVLIVPGKRIGLITPGMSAADLEKAYGKANVKHVDLDGPEGTTIPGARLFAGTERELEVIWADGAKVVEVVRVIGEAWTFENGLKAGMGIAEVEKLNGKPFKLFGWGWDYAGSAILEEGELAGKVMLTFDPGAADIPDGLNGDIELSSTDPRVRALKPVVASPISLFMGRAE